MVPASRNYCGGGVIVVVDCVCSPEPGVVLVFVFSVSLVTFT